MSQWDVVGIGETLALFSMDEVGRLEAGARGALAIGGAETNALVGLARLGLRTAWIGRVGDDEFGELILRRLESEGVDVRHATCDPDAPTAVMVKWRRTSEQTRVTYARKASAGTRLSAADLPAGVVEDSAVLHVTGITAALGDEPRALVEEAVQRARASSTLVSFDVNYRRALWGSRSAADLTVIARNADVLLASSEEAGLLVGSSESDEESLVHRMAELGPAWSVLKLGHRGAIAAHDGVLLRAQAPAVSVIDPVGAGDAFAAGLVSGVIERLEPQASLDRAVAMGSWACTVQGDFDGLPTRGELEAAASTRDPVVR